MRNTIRSRILKVLDEGAATIVEINYELRMDRHCLAVTIDNMRRKGEVCKVGKLRKSGWRGRGAWLNIIGRTDMYKGEPQ